MNVALQMNEPFDKASPFLHTLYARVTARFVAATVNYAIGRGISMEEITAATGLKRTELIDGDARLPDSLISKLWRLLDTLPSGLSPALHMAGATPPTIFGPCEHLIRYAPCLRTAFNAVARFGKIIADRAEITTHHSQSMAAIQIWHPLDESNSGKAGEVGLAMLFRLIEECQEDNFLIGVDFAHQAIGSLRGYESFFRVPVRFGQPRNTLHYRPDALDLPMRDADEHLFRYVQSNLELLEDRWQIPGQRTLISRIYAGAQANAEQGRFSAEELAITLRVNLRKLQREAKSHGSTVISILDEAREARAKQLLDDPSNNIESISQLLGYSDGRAFRRAFARWTSKTPSEYRSRTNHSNGTGRIDE